MNVTCVQCREPLPITATFCSACGRPTDADKDGVPDALGSMIEAKARAILADDQRAREAAAARDDADATLKKLAAEAVTLQTQLETNERMPRTWLASFKQNAPLYVIMLSLAWLLVGLPIHLFGLGLIGVSPAGIALCSTHCDGCQGPGRVYAWNFKGGWQENKGRMGYALVCHNREVDIDKLDTFAITRSELNTRLQPYMIHGVLAFVVEGLILAPGLGVLLAATRTKKRLRALDAEHAELTAKLRLNAQQRAALGEPVDGGSYRGV